MVVTAVLLTLPLPPPVKGTVLFDGRNFIVLHFRRFTVRAFLADSFKETHIDVVVDTDQNTQ